MNQVEPGCVESEHQLWICEGKSQLCFHFGWNVFINHAAWVEVGVLADYLRGRSDADRLGDILAQSICWLVREGVDCLWNKKHHMKIHAEK